jgi:hypothetical protein
VSQTSVITQNVRPRASRSANEPANWGRRLGKNAAIFGFPRLLSRPWRNEERFAARTVGRECPRTAASRAWRPSQTR